MHKVQYSPKGTVKRNACFGLACHNYQSRCWHLNTYNTWASSTPIILSLEMLKFSEKKKSGIFF
jgi:hypothetical protein